MEIVTPWYGGGSGPTTIRRRLRDAPFCDGGSCGSTCTAGRMACGMACVDVLTDPSHCSACNVPCVPGAHQTARCEGGTCVTTCESGWDDCNADPSDGCEQSLEDVWWGDRYLGFRDTLQTEAPPEPCRGCGVKWSL